MMVEAERVGRYWLPPLFWMGVIFWFSTDRFSATHTSSILETFFRAVNLSLNPTTLAQIHFLIRKLAHITSYAILTLLLYRALRAESTIRWKLKWAVAAFIIAAVYALADEYHQSLTSERSASFADSFIDMTGSLCALGGVWIKR